MSNLKQYEEELQDIMEETNQVAEVQDNEAWQIENMETAVWADNIVHEKEREVKKIEKIANDNIQALQDKITKLEEWKEKATSKPKYDIEFFKGHLHLFHSKLMEQEKAAGKKKVTASVKLPYRTLTYRKQTPEVFVGDKKVADNVRNEAFVKAVKELNPEMITEQVKWGELKKTLVLKDDVYVDKETGTVIEELKVVQRGYQYGWTVKEEDKENG